MHLPKLEVRILHRWNDRHRLEVFVDEPARCFSFCLWKGVLQIWETKTPRLAIVRFHGRNYATWNVEREGQTAASVRFNYCYPSHELSSFLPDIKALAERVNVLHAIFNNNQGVQGQRT